MCSKPLEPEVPVRQADIHDAARIAEIHVQSWKAAYRGLLPQPYLDQLNPAHRQPTWERALSAPSSTRVQTLVADSGHGLNGFISFGPTRDEDRNPAIVGEITSIYLLSTVWHTGIGKELMQAALDALQSAGFHQATLWVLDTNIHAISFYQRGGWTHDNSTKPIEIGGAAFTEARFELRLTTPTADTSHS